MYILFRTSANAKVIARTEAQKNQKYYLTANIETTMQALKAFIDFF